MTKSDLIIWVKSFHKLDKAPGTVRTYLNNVHNFVCHVYRKEPRVYLSVHLSKIMKDCKKADTKKANLAKYDPKPYQKFLEQMEKHKDCEHVKKK